MMRIQKSYLSAFRAVIVLCLAGSVTWGCAGDSGAIGEDAMAGSDYGSHDWSDVAEGYDYGYERWDTVVATDTSASDSSVSYDTTASSDATLADSGLGEDTIEEPDPQAGQLTAAEWDDNLNLDRFVEWVSDSIQSWPGMAFLPIADRIIINVTGSDGKAMSGVRVEVTGQDGTVLDVLTRPNGQALLFPAREDVSSIEGLTVRVTGFGDGGLFEGPLVVSNGYAMIQVDVPGVRPAAMDLAFVVDATGSMTDELSFLKSEIADIVDEVQAVDQQLSLRYALIVYRDAGDEYVTRVFDFTDSLSEFQANLGNQRPDGGGDYEEAVQEAYKKMNGLSWRDGNVARVAFHMADAPCHTVDSAAFLAQVEIARRNSIGVYPVAASGVADAAQYLMRMAAQSTLARYLFITDDSGIGGGHAGGEPTIATTCMQVQYLNNLIKRLLRSELAGEYIPPTDNEILREAGDPTDGVCVFEDGSMSFLWL